ncbi:hypothetical protein DMN91_008272 [Ooceraea biroi]|uniref:Uncharacterized protein n=1 Tax=Ooceraea biroi TaxID=2015173 RepID=A0A3L8DGZ5_OOCBI|nr:hypothetical protein DMN91_008272 [Ooceraea biroi]
MDSHSASGICKQRFPGVPTDTNAITVSPFHFTAIIRSSKPPDIVKRVLSTRPVKFPVRPRQQRRKGAQPSRVVPLNDSLKEHLTSPGGCLIRLDQAGGSQAGRQAGRQTGRQAGSPRRS